ncbi:hypothetical protein ACFRMQ_40190 [Kitasatospora sp. NPDC056783]|uniref:hypothetical protein n=1 Tax=Kitasatospora sp. NPDC056783 TaxID=3345943 RepID=UPI0036837DF6
MNVSLLDAWFRSRTRPRLPVLEMIGGEFAAPDNWIRSGDAVRTADAFAARHNGFAPILVFADATGGFRVDTECVDGPHGHAESHLLKDVPPFVRRTTRRTFPQAGNPGRTRHPVPLWAFVGNSR